MKLIIFDLDQTLVDFIAIHDEAVGRLFKTMFGVEARLTEIDFAGRSLTDNLVELGKLKGISAELLKEESGELVERYEQIFAESIPQDVSHYILPGARELLDELSKTDNLIVLYTGDSPGIVKVVLESTGLDKYFKFSLSGTEVKSRADMVRQAIAEARRLTGRKFQGKDVVIIGDSVRNIECGKEFNALTIAVATGFHSEEELRRKAPDYLFKDLRDYEYILQSLG
jgi:phosphoglycolate phosphatase